HGDRIEAASKNVVRNKLVDLLHRVGYYVLFTSQGNALVAETAGYQVARRAEKVVLAKPGTPVVENSSQPGEMMVSTRRVPGARSYVFQYSDGPEPAAGGWMSQYCTAAKCRLAGLRLGREYAFRIGAIGANRQIMYSDVVKRYAS
ncbi:MAG TPA: hypothetical protein VMR70_06190, partial [Flavisolibacter sp.]|nr:hypothetical protein [Flavisolibacter sp.]